MEPETKLVRRLFWAWQDEQEEQWLGEMARQGWHLCQVALLTYTFQHGAPRNDTYRLDYKPGRDMAEYLAFITEAGWEHIGTMSGWQYFRLPEDADETAELYTDVESKIARHKRIIGTLLATSPAFLVVFMSQMDRYPLWFAILFVTFFVLLTTLYSISMIKLAGRIKQLQRL
ncbi:MAG: DUF2812 domain-containing protein [Anaerolineae bacterium]|nr:DUF2812 domain-containing protein [Anaerolineae bacterium]